MLALRHYIHLYFFRNTIYFGVNRIVDLWNTLPQSVIDAKDVRQFEIRLDKYWEHQDVKFEYKASIQNILENPRMKIQRENFFGILISMRLDKPM
jgi:ABC-type bacteriocin/lantibiotic exporter with double-glycine peptidase domain